MSIVPYIPGIQAQISDLPKLTPSSATGYIRTISDIISNIKAFIKNDCKYPNYIKDTWINQLDWLQSLCVLKEKKIGLYGAAGVGKSSLIQALLDEQALLPTDSQRACTACVCEIRNNPNDKTYKAYIIFLTIDEWKEEVENLMMMLSDKQGNRKLRSSSKNNNREQIVSKLKSVYGSDDIENWTVEKLCKDPRLEKYLKKDSHEIILNVLTATDVRKGLKEYLTSPKTKNAMALWPLIKRVKVCGPFEILNGVSLVDLPGFGDWNAARDKIAQDNLYSCDSIWVVAEATRASDSSTFKKILNDNIQRQLIMDGKMSELVYICTKSDVMEVQDDDLENLQLTEEYERLDGLIEELEDSDNKDASHKISKLQQRKKTFACTKRNESIKKVLRENFLEEISQKLSNRSDSEIEKRYQNIPIYTISATSYLKLLKNKQDLTLSFSQPEQTELPQLREFLRAEGHHRVEVVQDIIEKLYDIYQPIHMLVSYNWDHIISKMEECESKINICLRDLRKKLKETTSSLSASLKSIISDRLGKEVWRATQIGKKDGASNLTRYVMMNSVRWNTYQATCRRYGEFKDLDFNQALLDPFLSAIASGWESAFISDVQIIIKQYLNIFETIFRDFLKSLREIYNVASIPSEFTAPILKNFSSVTMQKALNLLNTLKQEIQNLQRNCSRKLIPIVQNKMTPGYEEASNCSGIGCYNRMKSIVNMQAFNVTDEMFNEIHCRVVNDLGVIMVNVDKACSELTDISEATKTLDSFVKAIKEREIGDWNAIRKQSSSFEILINLYVKVIGEHNESPEQDDHPIEDIRDGIKLLTLD